MKKKVIIAVVLGSLLISINLSASIYNSQIDDTIRIKAKDKSEIMIVVSDLNDIENVNSELNAVMDNLDKIFDQLEVSLEGMDSVINISVKNIDEKLFVDVKGVEDDENTDICIDISKDINFRKPKTLHGFTLMELGMNNYLEKGKFPNDNAEQYSVKPWGSWNVALGGGIRWYFTKPVSIDIAASFSWYNFKYADKSTRVMQTANDVVFSSDTLGADYIKSKTTVPFINLSIMPMVHFGSKNRGVNHKMFRLGAGVYAGYRLGGHVKHVSEMNDTHSKYKNKGDYFLNSYRYGVKAVFGVYDINLFAAYDLSTLYAENKGHELNPISFGLNFTF
ncbi:MAG: outer membrane beta-barrel protein [Bacteroidales bacterium]|nr:outer membrane beta-barrel protein [Bacteroidales bacterium]